MPFAKKKVCFGERETTTATLQKNTCLRDLSGLRLEIYERYIHVMRFHVNLFISIAFIYRYIVTVYIR